MNGMTLALQTYITILNHNFEGLPALQYLLEPSEEQIYQVIAGATQLGGPS